MKIEEIIDVLRGQFSELSFELLENSTPGGIIIPLKGMVDVMQFLHSDERCYFDMLSCVTGVDNGPEENSMELVYNLYSIPYDIHLAIKVIVPRQKPMVESLVAIWKTADWQEREVYDMYGIDFLGHPDLRRILMPADWEGFPLRKDYKEQKYYRGMEVKY